MKNGKFKEKKHREKLNRPCDRCGHYYQRKGRGDKFCSNCYKKPLVVGITINL